MDRVDFRLTAHANTIAASKLSHCRNSRRLQVTSLMGAPAARDRGEPRRRAAYWKAFCGLILLQHEPTKECRELHIAIQRENVRDVLVRTHDNHATSVSIYATHCEDVRAVF